jgi:SAM-dependent methyltransferase
MYESSKTNNIRGAEFRSRYFFGRVIDIGCGADIVMPQAIPFDVAQGDAQRMLDYFQPESFDCVHSSHCLEHMRDVKSALQQWWALVKPSGYLVVVVPDEDLYEQGAWPSLFNADHKATFRLGKIKSWSPVSYDLEELARGLPDSQVVDVCIQDDAYDRRLIKKKITGLGRLFFKLARQRRRAIRLLVRIGFPIDRLSLAFDRLENALGIPVDQTLGPALAQIQLIARKSG